MPARVLAFPVHRLRRRASARVFAPMLDLAAQRRAELALCAATATFTALAALVTLLFAG